MHRPGTDPTDVEMSDILCDFCGSAWTDERPMVEGHRGSVICGSCLSLAYVEVTRPGAAEQSGRNAGEAPASWMCRLCRESSEDRAILERSGERGWQSPLEAEAWACARCIRQSAGVLHKDPDIPWRKPGTTQSSETSEE